MILKKVLNIMIKNIVHYVGFLMLVLFISAVTVRPGIAQNSNENVKIDRGLNNPTLIEIKNVVQPSPANETQLYLVLFREINICQATVLNLGKLFSVSEATIRNIDPNLPILVQLQTLQNVSKARYSQLAQLEQVVLQKLREAEVPNNVLQELGTSQFTGSINYGMRMFSQAHTSPQLIEGFIATLLQQNVMCESNIASQLKKVQNVNAPPSLPPADDGEDPAMP